MDCTTGLIGTSTICQIAFGTSGPLVKVEAIGEHRRQLGRDRLSR